MSKEKGRIKNGRNVVRPTWSTPKHEIKKLRNMISVLESFIEDISVKTNAHSQQLHTLLEDFGSITQVLERIEQKVNDLHGQYTEMWSNMQKIQEQQISLQNQFAVLKQKGLLL